MHRHDGFTLIELLIVIVIIGILAAVAVPKFAKTRERAHFRTLMSDLRNLSTQQELYYTLPRNNYTYASALTDLPHYRPSHGATVSLFNGTAQGWAATASHVALGSDRMCGIYIGTTAAAPDFLAAPGVVLCTGE